jgi:anti-sigma regulatory factor (Ser/Thr protein kinase)
MAMTSFFAPAGVFTHAAFFYDTADQYVDVIASFLEEGLTAGEPALVAVPRGNLELIRAGLGGVGETVSFQDMSVLGRNPARIIPVIRRFTDSHPGGRTRFVGEPLWAGRSPAEIQEVARHEALVNAAFADVPTAILCPYRSDRPDQAVRDDAEVTHPHLLGRGRTEVSTRYAGAAAALAIAEQRLPAPPGNAEELVFEPGDLPSLRRLIRKRAASAGLSDERAEDLTIAVNEAATNTISHTHAPGRLRLWQDATTFICEIRDGGHIRDPLAGRHLASAVAGGGHGLRVVNQVCDLVELRTGPWGTAIRMHMDRA